MVIFRSFLAKVLTPIQYDYAEEVKRKLWSVGLYTDVDNGTDTLNKKIRNGELAQYNFIFGTLALLLASPDFRSHNTRSRR